MQQIPYHRKRIAIVNQTVHKMVNKEPVATNEISQIEKWYEDVIRNKEGIHSDFQTIRTFITP